MEGKRVNIKVVSLKEPCTACVIMSGLLKETLRKLKKEHGNMNLEFIELNSISQVHDVKGLEVEKFPAILINDEQFTAGSLPSKKELLAMLQQGGM